MIKSISLLTRRPELSHDDFVKHWLEVHAPLARQFPGLRRYSVNFIDREATPNAVYDGFSELWFDSEDALNAALGSPIAEAIAADIPRFMDELVRVIVEEHPIVE
jgi:uncharacterized protein (TIGR02118 family)